MIFEALLATLADFARGLIAVALVIGFLAVISYMEKKYGGQEPELEPEIESEDIWAGLTPDRDVRRAEARFESDRWAA